MPPTDRAPGCHHLFAHPTDDTEHAELADQLAYARSIGDSVGILIALNRLSGAAACRAARTAAAE